jgi:hypothetical protein
VVNVWAYRTEKLKADFVPAGEWDYAIQFDTLDDLLEDFKKNNIPKGQVGKLGIIAHGDTPGVVQLKPVHLTKGTAAQYQNQFRALREYLWMNARIIFYSCIAGGSTEGSNLLKTLSGQFFDNQHVIGFEKYGLVNTGTQPAGTMRCTNLYLDKFKPEYYCDPTATMKTVTDVRMQTEQILSEYAIYAKWSFKGQIISLPYSERTSYVAVTPDIIYGPDAIAEALKDPGIRSKIEYVAISKKHASNKLINLWMDIQQRYRITPRELSETERNLILRQKRKLKPHEEAIAVSKAPQPKAVFKCAWGGCPTHKNVIDRCKDFLDPIPNGPLV